MFHVQNLTAYFYKSFSSMGLLIGYGYRTYEYWYNITSNNSLPCVNCGSSNSLYAKSNVSCS